MGLLFIPYEGDQPISLRTARHVTGVMKSVNMLKDVSPENEIIIENVPSYKEIKDGGLGKWLKIAK